MYPWVCQKCEKSSIFTLDEHFSIKRWYSWEEKQNLAAVERKTLEEHHWNGKSRNTSIPRLNEVYLTQVSEKIKGKFTQWMSREINRTDGRIFGALPKTDVFVLNPKAWTQSGTVPRTSWTADVECQEPNEDRSQRKILILKWDPQSISPITQFT